MKYQLNPNKFFAWLFGANAFFICIHLVLQFLYLNAGILESTATLFNMDAEANIPTWFTVALFIILAQLLLFLGLESCKKRCQWQWFVLAALALYLSVDEASAIHERLIEPMQQLFGITSGPLFFAWTIPVACGLVLLAVLFGRFYWQLDRKSKIRLALAAGLYVLGAIGFEMISGAYWQAHDFQYDMIYRILNAFEEGLENVGIITAIYAISHKIEQ